MKDMYEAVLILSCRRYDSCRQREEVRARVIVPVPCTLRLYHIIMRVPYCFEHELLTMYLIATYKLRSSVRITKLDCSPSLDLVKADECLFSMNRGCGTEGSFKASWRHQSDRSNGCSASVADTTRVMHGDIRPIR